MAVKSELDGVDRKILRILTSDGRASYQAAHRCAAQCSSESRSAHHQAPPILNRTHALLDADAGAFVARARDFQQRFVHALKKHRSAYPLAPTEASKW